MTPLAVPVASPQAGPLAKPASAPPPAAPAPQPLAAPAMTAPVQWEGAVRPPDALMRAFRPDLLAADADRPTGPPPAFAANVLDQLPDSLTPAEADAAADAEAEAQEAQALPWEAEEAAGTGPDAGEAPVAGAPALPAYGLPEGGASELDLSV